MFVGVVPMHADAQLKTSLVTLANEHGCQMHFVIIMHVCIEMQNNR